MKKLSKRLSLSFTLLLIGSLVCSSGAAVIAETTTEPVTEESQLIKSPEESLPEAPPVLDVTETTDEDTETIETGGVATETQEAQEASEEIEAPVEVVKETQETTETTESEEKPEKSAKKLVPQNTGTGAFTVEGGEIDNHYTFENHVLKFVKSGDFSVSGVTWEDRIVVAATNVKLTLSGVNIDVSANDQRAALLIEGNATAMINLLGENALKSGYGCAGLQNNNQAENSLVIDSNTGAYQGHAGSLNARGGHQAAGIGNVNSGVGTVTINGGSITSATGNYGSGIGGGINSAGKVIINGGNITASGGFQGSGIGGGFGRNGTVIINGGTVTATGGSDGGSGIGTGKEGSGGSVTINGGSVKAVDNSGTTESISPRPENNLELCNLIPSHDDAEVSVDGDDYEVAGSHENDDKYYLYLTKDAHEITVETADGQQQTYAVRWDGNANKFVWNSDFEVDNNKGVSCFNNELILGGNDQAYNISMREDGTTTKKDRIKVTGSNVTVKLNDVKIDVSENANQAALLINSNASATVELVGENKLQGGLLCAGLQNDNATENSLIIHSEEGIIQGYAGSLTATGSFGGAGIGGANEKNGTVSITGGSITATGSSGGAGIGGGNKGTGMITIDKGKITATGIGTGSGIGSGGSGKNGTVTIESGDIEAIGGDAGGAGIGGGSSGNGMVTINDGNVTATGKVGGSGIGGGSGFTTGTEITINGGKIIATGGNLGSGIGGGNVGSGKIAITGGTVTATGGTTASGIGRGQNGNGGEVIISGGSVKASANGKIDSIDPRPTINGDTELALCNLISFKENDQILVEGKDYQVSGLHKDDDKAHLYLTKENHKVTVINNGQPKDHSVFWDEQANKFILWNSELVPDNFTEVSYDDAENEVILAGDDETYNITMREGLEKTIADRIKVTGKNVTVKLNDVKIDVSATQKLSAFLIDSGASATVDLTGENELKSGKFCAGLQNNNEAKESLVIKSGTGSYQGYAGSLNATSKELGAGIGSGTDGNSAIDIYGGLITANGGSMGSGIGGGPEDGNEATGNGKVTIHGGVITANAGNRASGIGGGKGGFGIVTIHGGTIKTTGGSFSSGIGNGSLYSGEDGKVVISGGSVKAINYDTKANDSISPRPTNSDGDPVQLYQADASAYTDSSPVKVGTTDWKVNGKHIDDDNFYLYLPEEKHVVTVGDNESFIEWKEDKFIPASTYSLEIPPSVILTNEGKKDKATLTNKFHGVAGYNKQVTASLSTDGMTGKNLILKNQGDNEKQAHSLITYEELTLPASSEKEETTLNFGIPTATTGNDPLQAGTYNGKLIFNVERTTEEVTP